MSEALNPKDFYRYRRDGTIRYLVNKSGARRRKSLPTGHTDPVAAMKLVREIGVDRFKLLSGPEADKEAPHTYADVFARFILWAPTVMARETARVYCCNIKAIIRNMRFGAKPIDEVADVELSHTIHADQPTFVTAKGRIKMMKKFYEFAINRGYTTANPANLVKIQYSKMTIRQVEKREVYPMTDEEFNLALAHMPQPWRDWTVLGYCCGLRIGDAVSLEWDSLTKGHIVFYPLKTRKTKRLEIPFNNPFIKHPELDELIGRLLAQPRYGPYVWPTSQAKFELSTAQFSTRYIWLLRQIGIIDRSFHSLRRAMMVRLDKAGLTLHQIAGLVGHSSPKMTQHYIDSGKNLPTSRDIDDEAVELLSG